MKIEVQILIFNILQRRKKEMTISILLPKAVGKQKTKMKLEFHFQRSRKTEKKMESRISFSDSGDKRKMKLGVSWRFSMS